MASTTTLTCAGCSAAFEKRRAEVSRQRRKNPDHPFYCSRRCFAEHKGKYSLGADLGCGRTAHLDPANQRDEHTPFRYFMRKARNRKHETDLDLPYLKALWEEQEGTCPLTGTKMDLPVNGRAWEKDTGNPWKPSLDRIDSSKGYIKGNVRYIVSIANFCKQSWDDDVVIDFCGRVARRGSDPGRVE